MASEQEQQEAAAQATPTEDVSSKILTILEGMDSAMRSLSDRVEALETRPDAPEPEAEAAPEVPVAAKLPEGTVRFRTVHKDFRVEMKKTVKQIAQGEVIVTPGKWLNFSRGIFDTNDPEEIEFLTNRPYFGTTLFIDPEATPHQGVVVTDGPKSTTKSVRAGGTPAALAVKL